MTDLEICNLALQMIGQDDISQAELSTPTVKAARLCSIQYPATRKAVLKAKAWSFASRWAVARGASTAIPPTLDPGCPTLYAVPEPTQPFSVLRLLTCLDINGNAIAWTPEQRETASYVERAGTTSTTATMYESATITAGDTFILPIDSSGLSSEDFAAGGAYSAGAILKVGEYEQYVQVLAVNANGTISVLALSDITLLAGDVAVVPVEGGAYTRSLYVASDIADSSILVRYVQDVPAETLPDDVAQAIATRLASALAVPLTENGKLQADLWALSQQQILAAARLDGAQSSPVPMRVRPSKSILFKRRA